MLKVLKKRVEVDDTLSGAYGEMYDAMERLMYEAGADSICVFLAHWEVGGTIRKRIKKEKEEEYKDVGPVRWIICGALDFEEDKTCEPYVLTPTEAEVGRPFQVFRGWMVSD